MTRWVHSQLPLLSCVYESRFAHFCEGLFPQQEPQSVAFARPIRLAPVLRSHERRAVAEGTQAVQSVARARQGGQARALAAWRTVEQDGLMA